MNITKFLSKNPFGPVRSPRLLNPASTVLMVVDLQERLLSKIHDHREISWNATRLVRASQILKIALEASEQYPEKLGETTEKVRSLIPSPHAKRAFSVGELTGVWDQHAAAERSQIVLCGIETHVCILQSALDLTASGFDVFVVTDAVASRRPDDHAVALQRMQGEGVTLTTTESVLFEWCATSTADGFKQISQLVQEHPSEYGIEIGFGPDRRARGGG